MIRPGTSLTKQKQKQRAVAPKVAVGKKAEVGVLWRLTKSSDILSENHRETAPRISYFACGYACSIWVP